MLTVNHRIDSNIDSSIMKTRLQICEMRTEDKEVNFIDIALKAKSKSESEVILRSKNIRKYLIVSK